MTPFTRRCCKPRKSIFQTSPFPTRLSDPAQNLEFNPVIEINKRAMKNACMQTTFATRAVFRELNKTKTGILEIVRRIQKRFLVSKLRCGWFNVKVLTTEACLLYNCLCSAYNNVVLFPLFTR